MKNTRIMCARTITLIVLAVAATSAFAAVTSTPLVKAPLNTKSPLFIDAEGSFACPTGSDLFVRAIKVPVAKDSKEPAAQGDYESFYFARSANPSQPAIIVSRPGLQEYVPACLAVK